MRTVGSARSRCRTANGLRNTCELASSAATRDAATRSRLSGLVRMTYQARTAPAPSPAWTRVRDPPAAHLAPANACAIVRAGLRRHPNGTRQLNAFYLGLVDFLQRRLDALSLANNRLQQTYEIFDLEGLGADTREIAPRSRRDRADVGLGS